VSTIAALAAHTLKKPVRIALNRDEDMWATGNRVCVLSDAV
jgi:xanthine dehydrogenase molybdopterin-binding subunit B